MLLLSRWLAGMDGIVGDGRSLGRAPMPPGLAKAELCRNLRAGSCMDRQERGGNK